jgi:hypothetical protein
LDAAHRFAKVRFHGLLVNTGLAVIVSRPRTANRKKAGLLKSGQA